MWEDEEQNDDIFKIHGTIVGPWLHFGTPASATGWFEILRSLCGLKEQYVVLEKTF